MPEVIVKRLPINVDLLALHRLAPDKYPFLLQSTAAGGATGRYDILFALPGNALVLDGPGRLHGPGAAGARRFLAALDAWWRELEAPRRASELPFTGGWFVYLGYELAGEVEPSLDLAPDPLLPTAFAVRCPAAVIRDHRDDACMLVAEPAAADILRLDADVRAVAASAGRPRAAALEPPVTVEEADAPFLAAVDRARRYIAAGDIYQANLSRGWSTTVDPRCEAADVYASLCATNPGPFAGLVRWRDVNIISSSPERLLRVGDGIASTRPIAGTRPRSSDTDRDVSLQAELIAHPKERAEHVMLIDLERNDLGRICEAGSVEVDEMMVLESYAHVHHIVSNVSGRLRPDVSPGAAIRALFPGGTITGCPKVRCMQIIDELETGPRGAYTGSFGYLNRDGSLDLNILIRTMVMRGTRVSLRAGSGIVADSVPEAELAETRAKARGLLEALAS